MKKRFNIELPPDDVQRLERLKNKGGFDTYTETFKESLRALEREQESPTAP